MSGTITALTTLAAVKADLGIVDSTQDQDAAIERQILQASALIATYCGRDFGVQWVSEEFDRSGVDHRQARPLHLSCYPVVGLDSVTGARGALVEADYALEPGPGLLHRRGAGALASWRADLPVTVAYSAGYPDIPPDVEAVAVALVAAARGRQGRDVGVRSETTEGVGRTEYFETTSASSMALDPALRAQLVAYRVRA